MNAAPLQSDAYRLAELRSERTRAGALIALGAVFVVVVIVRAFVFGSDAEINDLPQALVLLGAFVLFETWMLWRISGALANEDPPQPWIFTFKVLVETQLPTAAMLLTTTGAFLGPYATLTAPALGAYYVFIIMATLRLDYRDAMVAGVSSALGYVALVAFTYAWYPDHPARMTVLPELLATNAILLLVAGWVASRVSRQIRAHLEVALREARTVERMGRDLEVARSIQQGLLPEEAPTIPGYQIAGWNDPADETGGDYFDWMTLPDGRAVITLADVTGHGIGPALVTAVCRAYGLHFLWNKDSTAGRPPSTTSRPWRRCPGSCGTARKPLPPWGPRPARAPRCSPSPEK